MEVHQHVDVGVVVALPVCEVPAAQVEGDGPAPDAFEALERRFHQREGLLRSIATALGGGQGEEGLDLTVDVTYLPKEGQGPGERLGRLGRCALRVGEPRDGVKCSGLVSGRLEIGEERQGLAVELESTRRVADLLVGGREGEHGDRATAVAADLDAELAGALENLQGQGRLPALLSNPPRRGQRRGLQGTIVELFGDREGAFEIDQRLIGHSEGVVETPAVVQRTSLEEARAGCAQHVQGLVEERQRLLEAAEIARGHPEVAQGGGFAEPVLELTLERQRPAPAFDRSLHLAELVVHTAYVVENARLAPRFREWLQDLQGGAVVAQRGPLLLEAFAMHPAELLENLGLPGLVLERPNAREGRVVMRHGASALLLLQALRQMLCFGEARFGRRRSLVGGTRRSRVDDAQSVARVHATILEPDDVEKIGRSGLREECRVLDAFVSERPVESQHRPAGAGEGRELDVDALLLERELEDVPGVGGQPVAVDLARLQRSDQNGTRLRLERRQRLELPALGGGGLVCGRGIVVHRRPRAPRDTRRARRRGRRTPGRLSCGSPGDRKPQLVSSLPGSSPSLVVAGVSLDRANHAERVGLDPLLGALVDCQDVDAQVSTIEQPEGQTEAERSVLAHPDSAVPDHLAGAILDLHLEAGSRGGIGQGEHGGQVGGAGRQHDRRGRAGRPTLRRLGVEIHDRHVGLRQREPRHLEAQLGGRIPLEERPAGEADGRDHDGGRQQPGLRSGSAPQPAPQGAPARRGLEVCRRLGVRFRHRHEGVRVEQKLGALATRQEVLLELGSPLFRGLSQLVGDELVDLRMVGAPRSADPAPPRR